MITPREIIAEMTIQEIGFKTLYHQLQNYIKISESEVQDFMSMGVKRPIAVKHVGYILNMKKHCPADFVPQKIEIVIPPRQLKLDISHKKTSLTRRTGNKHHNFGRHASLTKSETLDKHNKNTKHRLFIRKYIKDLGGVKFVSDKIKCSGRTVYSWWEDRDGLVFIPPRYINSLIKLTKKQNVSVFLEDLLNMMPEDKKIYYWKTNWPTSQS